MFIRNGNATGSIVYEDLKPKPKRKREPKPEVAVEPEPEPVEQEPDSGEVEDEPVTYDDGLPDMDWTRDALDRYALARGLDTTDLPNKQAVLDAIGGTTE